MNALLGLVGLATLALALAAGLTPRVVADLPGGGTVLSTLRDLGGRAVVGVVGGLLTTLAWRFAGSSGRIRTDERLDAHRTQPPEEVTVDPATVTGGGVQRRFETAIEAGEPERAADALRDRAIAVERATVGVDRATAVERVDGGEWTDDKLAASVVGRDVAIPVWARLRSWLDPASETRRRLRRTVAALSDRLDGNGPAMRVDGTGDEVRADGDGVQADDNGDEMRADGGGNTAGVTGLDTSDGGESDE